MDGTINLSTNTLVGMFNWILQNYPNPDDDVHYHGPFGPYGPGGPVLHRAWSNPMPGRLGTWTHPNPIQWRLGPHPNPWRLGPEPDPWYFATLGRAVIEHFIAMQELAQLMGEEQAARAAASGGEAILKFAEDGCGTPPGGAWIVWILRHHIKTPPPPPPTEARALEPIEKLAIGLQFYTAAQLLEGSSLQEPLGKAGNMLLESAFKGAE